MRFDHVLIADWSAAGQPTSARDLNDAIWIGEAGTGLAQETHFRTRAAAEAWLAARLAQPGMGRVLLGFDFALAWPVGFAAALTGRPDPRAVWRWLEAHLTDGPDNANTRFDLAAAINRRFPAGPGPFWSRPAVRADLTDLPPRRAGIDYAALGLGEHRRAERLAGAKPVWMLTNPGAVGSQSLVGQAMLARLVQPGWAVWPFDPPDVLAGARVVVAEVYPSLLGGLVAREVPRAGGVKDRAQVRLLARALAHLSVSDRLAPLIIPPADVPPEEGWILGAGHGELLRQAAVERPDAG